MRAGCRRASARTSLTRQSRSPGAQAGPTAAATTSRRCRRSPSTPTRRATSTTPSASRARAPGTAPTCTSPTCRTSCDDDGAIEREARRRTSSLYLPLFAEPMLPAGLSSDLCQSRPAAAAQVPHRRVRLCRRRAAQRSAVLPLAHQQRPPAHLRVRRRAHRRGGGRVGRRGIADPPRDVPDATTAATIELHARLRLAHDWPGVLRRRRQRAARSRSGSFEPEYAFDQAGALTGAVARPETPSHALVEEFMLAANEAVAESPAAQEGAHAVPRARAARARPACASCSTRSRSSACRRRRSRPARPSRRRSSPRRSGA